MTRIEGATLSASQTRSYGSSRNTPTEAALSTRLEDRSASLRLAEMPSEGLTPPLRHVP